jgi:hypothetical protein
MIYIANAFSLSMIERVPARLNVYEIGIFEARELAASAISAVGHETTAALFSRLLGRNVPVDRVNLQLRPGDVLLVGQYTGPRLPEGATTLPEGASIRWLKVRVEVRP